MLAKLKQVPLKVIISTLFLLALLTTMVVAMPQLGVLLLVVVAAVYSFVNVIDYLIGH